MPARRSSSRRRPRVGMGPQTTPAPRRFSSQEPETPARSYLHSFGGVFWAPCGAGVTYPGAGQSGFKGVFGGVLGGSVFFFLSSASFLAAALIRPLMPFLVH